jgi:hypothetical protein
MKDLVYDANQDMIFSDELYLAIFWEESFFNNRKQQGGSAVGFGQIEPAEFYQLKKYGVYLSTDKVLHDDSLSATATILYMRHLTAALGNNDAALRAYAGYSYDHAAWRLAIIDGWKRCARMLQSNSDDAGPVDGGPVMDALGHARAFSNNAAAFHGILFPGDDNP